MVLCMYYTYSSFIENLKKKTIKGRSHVVRLVNALVHLVKFKYLFLGEQYKLLECFFRC